MILGTCGEKTQKHFILHVIFLIVPEMTDLETTFLRSAINEVIPDLAEVSKDILEETLQSLGIETSDDFKFLKESDLLTALRPIQARKVLAAWKLRSKYSNMGCS